MLSAIETFQRTFYVLSFALNVILLVIVPLKSSKEMGLYKYLLFSFVLNDIVYTNVHFATNLVVVLRGDIYVLFSERFPERWVISAFTTSHSHSFVLLFYHFIYRYIAVAKHQWLRLFSTWWFLIVLILFFILESTLWFLLLYFGFKTDVDTFEKLYPQIVHEFPNLTNVGVATAHYWRSDNSFRIRPFIGWAGFSSFMTAVFCVVLYCAVTISRFLNSVAQSKKTETMQRQLFYTLLVQFSVPFFLMYMPVVFVLSMPLFRISFDLPYHLISSFFIVFPFLDALVILFGVRDYRLVVSRLFSLLAFSRKSKAVPANLMSITPSHVASVIK